MSKKLLICGSVITVILLILVGLNPVIGFNSVNTSTTNSSPLFKIRINRVIDKQSKDILNVNHIGNNLDIPFLLPKRQKEKYLIQRFINWISNIDESTFNKFLQLIILTSEKNSDLREYNPQEISDALIYARSHPKSIKEHTMDEEPTVQIIGCIYIILLVIAIVVVSLILFIWNAIMTIAQGCF